MSKIVLGTYQFSVWCCVELWARKQVISSGFQASRRHHPSHLASGCPAVCSALPQKVSRASGQPGSVAVSSFNEPACLGAGVDGEAEALGQI